MILYVESNFVLEIAYFQEERSTCEELLALADSKEIELVIPAYSLTEPYETLVRRSNERRQLHATLLRELHQLSRSSTYTAKQESFQDVTKILIDSIEEHRKSLDSTIQRILSTARIISTTPEILSASLTNKERLGLQPQDAFVYSSILFDAQHAPTGPKCFITKNKKDFENPDIEPELMRYDCKLMWNFKHRLGYTKSKL